MVVVVSAQGDTTDELLQKAAEICPAPPAREMDMCAAGHRRTDFHFPAVHGPLPAGVPGGIPHRLAGGHDHRQLSTTAAPASSDVEPGTREDGAGPATRSWWSAGFQGRRRIRATSPLIGRGGSDTTAVALAAALRAARCHHLHRCGRRVHRRSPVGQGARKLDEITYDEMLELASLGAQVLHNRSVELAKRYRVDLEVLSSFTNEPGTLVRGGDHGE